MTSRRRVSLSAIGQAIRRAQSGMRAARRGLSVAERRKLDAKIRRLDRHYNALRVLCRQTWNVIDP